MSNSLNSSNQQETEKKLPLFILIDGHSIAFRAYYAFGKSKYGPLKTRSGIPTSICFGFLNSILQIIKTQQPEFVAIAFDRKEPTFRHEADANYKANRKEIPEGFLMDINNLQGLLKALNLQMVSSPGYEADDVLATVAKQIKGNYQIKIVTGDRDLFQLVEPDLNVLYLEASRFKNSSNNYTEFDEIAVERKLKVQPFQVVDYKALCGDSSDNIPGVKGIGAKTAEKLLKEYKTLEEIYQNIEQIKGTIAKKLKEGEKDAFHSQFLAKIVDDAPIEIDLEKCKLQGFNTEDLQPLLEKYELKKFLKSINELQSRFGGTIIEEPIIDDSFVDKNGQTSLFASPTPPPKSTNRKSRIIKPKIIDTLPKLTELIELLHTKKDSAKPVAWDTETTSLDIEKAELVGIGCCWGEAINEMAYIPLAHHLDFYQKNDNQLDKEEVLSALRPILEGDEYPKAFHNTKFDRLILKKEGIQLGGFIFDTILASYLLAPEKSHKLSNLSEAYLSGIRAKDYDDLGLDKKQTIADLDIKTAAEYCGLDAYATFLLIPKLQEKLAEIPALEKLFLEVEIPLEKVLATMEEWGIKIDTNYLKELSQQIEKDLKILEEEVYQEVGEKFNLGSTKQLNEILFEKLGLDKKKARKIKTGYSTDRATLEKLQGDHIIIEKLLEYRTLTKLKTTYIDTIPTLVSQKTQRVHTNFNQVVTTTGRLSSSNPNLQNIPIRTAFSSKIRQGFIPEDGWLLMSADYSQIELRILAHLSGEEVLLKAYQEGEDVHSVTAKLLLEKDTITSEERRLGKIINFGVIYGMGARKFAKEAKVSEAKGKEFIDKYKAKYSRIFDYLEKTKKEAIALGYVTTILGRRRYFNFGSEDLHWVKGRNPEDINTDDLKISYDDFQLLRAAANAPIQGSSADIIKLAMVNLSKTLDENQARLLLQVHDELVFEILDDDKKEEVTEQIKHTMEKAIDLSVPLVVDTHIGKNWMEAK